ncbi:hypothetical protein HK104_010687 [Borealophlyctis nickersoniae]|nr:hypothetical protein HK104_010687 [Borealophlyctis nickersoniae]
MSTISVSNNNNHGFASLRTRSSSVDTIVVPSLDTHNTQDTQQAVYLAPEQQANPAKLELKRQELELKRQELNKRITQMLHEGLRDDEDFEKWARKAWGLYHIRRWLLRKQYAEKNERRVRIAKLLGLKHIVLL